MPKDFYAIGHISNDLNPYPHVGGGVTYSSVVATRLGFKAHIITKCAVDSPYIQELENMGITMHVLPVRDKKYLNKTTAFTNEYDEKGKRTQYCPEQQEHITKEDLVHFPEISSNATILIAPVVGEVESELFEVLSKKGNLSVIPQGYFREFATDGKVSQRPLTDASFFQHAQYTILSEEDLGFDDGTFTAQLKEICPTLIITHGGKGSSIYQQNKETRIPAYRLDPSEVVDFTGAGDTYAASFLTQKADGKSDRDAGYFASFFAALKIAGLGGKEVGLPTIPTKEQIEQYMEAYNDRVSGYFTSSR